MFEKPTPDLYACIIGALGMGLKILLIEPWMPSYKFQEIFKKYKPKAVVAGFLGKLILKNLKKIEGVSYFSSGEINDFESGNITIEKMSKDDEGIISFTSGTTGEPKGVCRNHGYLIDQRSVLKKYLKYKNLEKLDLTVFFNLVMLNLILGKGSLVLDSSWKSSIVKQLDSLPDRFEIDSLYAALKFLEIVLDNTKKLKLDNVHVGGALGDIHLYEKADQAMAIC